MIDKKAIVLFLFLVFALGYPAQWAIFTFGLMTFDSPTAMDQAFFIAVLWIPALAAGITRLFFPVDASASSSWWPLPLVGVLRITFIVPLVALLGSGINLLVGGSGPDWRLGTVINQLDTSNLSPEVLAVLPTILLVAIVLGGAFLGTTIFAAIFFGGELGWRGTLQSRLSGLGAIPAAIVTGFFWALWFLPSLHAWFQFTGKPYLLPGFMAQVIILAMLVSYIAGQFQQRQGHLGLSAVFVGMLYSYAEVWDYLFPATNPPWSGVAGWISIVLWGLIAVLVPGLLAGKAPEAKVS